MNIDESINIICQKYGYDTSQREFLKNIIVNMINYYGEEYCEKIISTFLDTPIIYFETNEELSSAVKNLGINEDYYLSVVASAAYEEYYQKDENGNTQRIPFIMVRTNRSTDNPDQHLSLIVHEMCHAVMNHNKQNIEGDTVYSKTGLIEDQYIYDGQKYKSTSVNVPVEEGINEYDARKITQMILGREYKSTCYGMYVDYVSSLMNNSDIRKAINDSRLNGDDNWKQLIGEENANEFIKSLNDYNNAIFNYSDNKEEVLALKEQYEQIAVQTYKKMVELANNYVPESQEIAR